MKQEQNLFSRHWYIFNGTDGKSLSQDEAMKQLSTFYAQPNDWRDHERHEILKHYDCPFEELPKVEQSIILRGEKEWADTFGPNGSVEKEIKNHYEKKEAGKEKSVDPTTASKPKSRERRGGLDKD